MFGRMLADNPGYNVEAAVQVAHAFTTHGAAIEDDYFTAVDDLKSLDRAKDRGAGFISVNEFGSGVFYLYVCIDTNLLLKNLSDDKDLTKATLAAFVEAATKVSPSGKQNSYASRARAHFAMIERGSEAPRTLAAAFLKPVGMEGRDGIEESVKRLRQLREQFGRGYDEKFDAMAELDVAGDKGSLQEIITVATGASMPSPNAFLLFRLWGPMASSGQIAIGEQRQTWTRPSRSAVLGLVAAAHGIERGDSAGQINLEARIGFAVRIDDAGRPLATTIQRRHLFQNVAGGGRLAATNCSARNHAAPNFQSVITSWT